MNAPPALKRAHDLLQTGHTQQAEHALRRVLQRDPGDPFANHLLSAALLRLGRTDQALFFAQRAADSPDAQPPYFDVLGTVLASLGRDKESIDAFRRAVTMDPSLASAWNGLGVALLQVRRSDEAYAALATSVRLAPDSQAFATNYSYALGQAWRVPEAAAYLADAVARWPNARDLQLQLASVLNYTDGVDPVRLRREHERVGSLLAHELGAERPRPPFPDPRGRRLRVGLLSADFCDHSVAMFLEPVLDHLDRDRFVVACYSNTHAPDAVTERLRSRADLWHTIVGMSDDAAAARIREDAIDILLDLGGYTADTRTPVLVRRPAPVQINYLGYPNTLGMPAVDFRIVDSLTDPPGADAACTETLVRLDPCFVCYRPPAAELTAHADAMCSEPGASTITFGSFNLLNKLSPATIDLWARVLLGVAGSRLVLKASGLGVASTGERVVAAFAARGIDPSRVEAHAYFPGKREHFALYRRIDIALDPLPYHGTTTTCEAVWMGVPVISLRGATHASRVGVSLLTNIGLRDFLAGSPEEYIEIARRWSADRQRLAELKRGLRERLRRSVVCDAPAFAHRFGALLIHAAERVAGAERVAARP